MTLYPKKILIPVWLVCSVLGFAQQPADTSSSKSASSDEYVGPSILTRDKSLIGEKGGKLLDFRLYGSITGVYDSGLTPVSTDQSGKLVDVGGAYGLEAGFGVMGSKTWQKDSLSVDYRGSYRYYANEPYFDGLDQFLNLHYSRTVARHLTLDLKETAGVIGLANGGFSYLPLTSQDLVAVPTNELFDNRTYYAETRGMLVWQKTARLSFGFGGEEYEVRRRATSLAGLNGYSGRVDAAYRISRKQTLSVQYSYMHYDYQRLFGFANTQLALMGYNISLGRRFDFSVEAGAAYNEIRGLQTVNVDPAIVAIIGQPTVEQNFHRYVVIPAGEVRLLRRFNHAQVTVDASMGTSPGNGVFLASRQSAVTAGYSYTATRRWTMGANFAFTQLSTLGQSLGKYNGLQGGIGATYKLTNLMHMEFRYDYRHYTTQNNIFQKDSHRVSVGLAFSPGEKPLPIW